TPSAATVPSPQNRSDRDFLRGSRAAAGSGVVGAAALTVGASAVARVRMVAPRRAGLETITGCSGQTAVAKASMVGKRSSGSFDIARATAADNPAGMSGRTL